MKENTVEVSIRRHGEKDSQGELSAEGIEHAREVAREIFEQIKSAPARSLFFIVPSILGRAQKTRTVIESVLKEEIRNETEIEILSLQDRPDWTMIGSKKYVVTDFAPSTLIGYGGDRRTITTEKYWESAKDSLEGDEFAIFELWCAEEGELGAFKAEMKTKHEKVSEHTIDELAQSKFELAPEEYALKGYRWLERMRNLVKKYVPERPVKFLGISHNDISDFLTFELLGYKLNIETLRHFDSLRDFLEESTYAFLSGGGLEISYRGGKKTLTSQELADFPNRLKQEIEARKKVWNNPKSV